MITLKGPAIFLAQFLEPRPPFDSLAGIAEWAASLGFKGVQIPTTDPGFFDLERAATSKAYCEDVQATLAHSGLVVTELSTHLQGQLMAMHPAYHELFSGFAPAALRHQPSQWASWAAEQLTFAAAASRNLSLSSHVTFSGALAWHLMYPWPQRPPGVIDEAFAELGRRWQPVLDAFEDAGVDVCYELHPGEDLHDGITFERFLDVVGGHRRANILFDPSHLVLQHIDYAAFIDIYHDRIRAFHVKDAEFRPNGRSGVYGGYQGWLERAGRFRSLGDGQIDFGVIFSKLAQYDFPGWAVLEWECCLKHPEVGAAEGARFIQDHIIRVTDRAFDEFAKSGLNEGFNRRVLGLN